MWRWVSRRDPERGNTTGYNNTLTRLPRHVLQPLYLPLTPTMVARGGGGGRWFKSASVRVSHSAVSEGGFGEPAGRENPTCGMGRGCCRTSWRGVVGRSRTRNLPPLAITGEVCCSYEAALTVWPD